MIFDVEEINKSFDAQKWLEESYGCNFYPSSKGWLSCECPFDDHEDSNPSFGITPSGGIYKCFGCGKQGNFVDLVKRLKNYNFIQAIKFIMSECDMDFQSSSTFDYKNEKFKKALEEEDNTLHENKKIVQKAIIKIKKNLQENFDAADLMYKELDNLIEKDDYKTIKGKTWKL